MRDETSKLIEKAERSLRAAETLMRDGQAEFAAGRAYYAMMHAAQALLRERGMRFRKHSGVHAAVGQHLVKTGFLDAKYHRWLLDAFGCRIRGDYDIESPVEPDTAAALIGQAREFLLLARRLLGAGLPKGFAGADPRPPTNGLPGDKP